MTLLQAFKAACEFGYTNDNLYNKILTDRSLTSVTVYTKDYRDDIDMCLLDMYAYLKVHPNIQEGGRTISFDPIALDMAMWTIANRYDLSTADAISIGKGPTISGEARW
jgi:hypothetical protein